MKKTFLSLCFLVSTMLLLAQPRVVAHRGHWRTDGSAQNSIASLQQAAAVGCYGAEFDVWLTADGVPVVWHDANLDGIRVEDTTFAELMNHRLGNGEFLPTLQQYLQEGKKLPNIRLVLELKPHRNAKREEMLVQKVVELIRMLELQQQTDYISFSRYACSSIHRLEPQSHIAYLTGDLSPEEVKRQGWTGIDYNQDVFKKNPGWIDEAKRLGLEVNVWTVDGEQDLKLHAGMKGIDLITTNDPEILISILKQR